MDILRVKRGIKRLWDTNDLFRLTCCIGVTAIVCFSFFGLGTRVGEYFFHILH